MQFNITVECKVCHGSGAKVATLDSRDIMSIVNNHLNEDGEISKIPAIKTVRTKYGLHLKQAKDLVEGAMLFYGVIQKTANSVDVPSVPHWTEDREDEELAW